ncbi:MAG: NADH-quinone oxidoreductase subunit F [Bacteroidetes bacterium 4572_112]|nr:MAG: NADH-quinone oxidoreductase subunit F [Bacteroidetes bacterium 4572_112]
MVDPIFIVVAALGVGFLIGILGKLGKTFTGLLSLLTIAFMTYVSAGWLLAFYSGSQVAEVITTAGFQAPFSISLLMGYNEAFLTTIVNFMGLLGGIYLFFNFGRKGRNAYVVYIVFLMGLNVVIMSRDLFNLFVFLEITSIATAGLILIEDGNRTVGAGFKYMLATSVISSIFLLGIIFIYFFTGTLSLEDLYNNANLQNAGGAIAIFLVMVAAILEMKPFPANGWGLDVYEGSHQGFSALISTATATASFYMLYKILLIAGAAWNYPIALIGAFTFIGANLFAVKQKYARRMLSYSSIGQLGLLMMIMGLREYLGDNLNFIVVTVLLTNVLAKSGFFWLIGMVKALKLKEWAIIRRKPFMLFLMGVFIFALIGFPPFPSFFGKWEFIMSLAKVGGFSWIAVILIGSFFEAIYLFRWYGMAVKGEDIYDNLEFKTKLNKLIPVGIVTALLFIIGYFSAQYTEAGAMINFIPFIFVLVLFAVDKLPLMVKNIASIAALALHFYMIYPNLAGDNLRLIFEVIFMVGGILTLIAGFSYKGVRRGFYPVAILMYAGLTAIIEAHTTLGFFYGWELMTAGSYFLIIRGKKSMPHALSYMLFSIAGAYAILAGFSIAGIGYTDFNLDILNNIQYFPNWAYGLLLVGFLTKTASIGLHIWLPGAHGEAESDVSPMVSAILLKAGVFGVVLTLIGMTKSDFDLSTLAYILGWIGALTALVGNIGAVFQEDAKRLLAYSSIGQLGYIIFAFAIMTHLGWLTGFTYTINHFMYKAVLFLTIGAVVLRTGTHNMYEMGGLIKKMPFAFVAVLIGIIALSGVPPLSGFTGKWLFYNAVIEKGWYFQGTIVFFSGGLAFLYLFRLIHTIFLGQLKDNHRELKEISIWFLIPIYTLIAGLMVFSAKPQWVLQPLGEIIANYFPNGGLRWDGAFAYTQLGHWTGTGVMITIATVFVSILIILKMLTRKAHKLEQFDVVFSGERPERPETTHIAYNMYAGFYKAVWPLTLPYFEKFWEWATNIVHETAGFGRRVYSGNGQAYMLHIVLFIIVLFFITIGGSL